MIPTYKPSIELPDNICFGIGEKRIGDKVKFIVSYQVIEKTKSYIVLNINSAFLESNKRI